MNGWDAAVKIISLITTLTPPSKPAPTDYSDVRGAFDDYYNDVLALYDNMPTFGEGYKPVALIPERTREIEPEVIALPEWHEEVKELTEFNPVSTSCIACSRSHLVTIAGALEEGLRFARDGGILHPEAVRRIDASEREVTNLERIDLAPDAILKSPQREQELARYFIPKIRDLRQKIGQIASVDQMEEAAAAASILSQEFRLRQMEMAGADLNPIINLARLVEAGELSIEEARERVKQYLPPEA